MKRLLIIFSLFNIFLVGILSVTSVLAVAVMPSGESRFATFITATTATLNGYVENDGGEDCEVRFQYYIDGGDWTENETPYVAGYKSGEEVSADITGLTTESLYYCRVQIKNGAGTFDGDSVAFTAYAAPSMPSTWFSTPDYTKFRHTFFYGIYNLIADLLQMPRATFYLLATIFWCIALAIVALIIGKRLMPAIITLCGLMSLAALIKLLPMFFVIFSIFAIWGMIKMGHPREE